MTRIWAAVLTVLLGAAVLVAAPAPASAGDTLDTYALVDPATGYWYLFEGDRLVTHFYFGNPGDFPFAGDWNCNGIDTPGLFRQSDGYVYLRNSNSEGVADISYYFGNPGDVPIAGDFNADGCDTVSIYRPSNQRFYIINRLGTNDMGLGTAEYSFIFGNPGDEPFSGDFNGNGQDTPGLHRESTGLVYYRNTNTQGNADNTFIYGNSGDRFVAGDWTGNGVDTPGVYRTSNNTMYLRYQNSEGIADEAWSHGMFVELAWLPVAGNLSNCDTQSSIPAIECEALIALYRSTHGGNWKRNTGWVLPATMDETGFDPCHWYGVTCSAGSVVGLNLSENRLSGTIPPELGNLTNLTYLNLILNDQLSGTIPPELGNLTNLRDLRLAYTQLSGTIPPQLGNLSNLTDLYLPYNQLSAAIPPELGNLTHLRDLILTHNQLSGPIPPGLGNLTSLRRIEIGQNAISGTIPAELGTLTDLTYLSLPYNQLSGEVPLALGDLTLSHLGLFGQAGCLTTDDVSFAAWLYSLDPGWNDGCPVP